MPEPKSSLVDVIMYLKSDESLPSGTLIKGTPTPTSEMKVMSEQDRLELRHSLDAVRASQ
jgi:hypothetical protein